MKIKFGYREMDTHDLQFGSLVDSASLINDAVQLKQRLADDGYLLLRGLIDRDVVLKARETILSHMEANKVLSPDTPILEGVMPKGGRGVRMMGTQGIAQHEDVLAVLENPILFTLFETLFDEPATTFPYKWLRGVGNEAYTGAHYDYVYMGQGSPRVHTMWVPFGDLTVDHGTLAMCAGSHKLDSFAKLRDTYGRMDVDRDAIEGWFTKDPMEITEKFGGQWLIGEYQAGDVILFGMHMMHASTTNLTNRFRISCDVRFQPASDALDERWRKDGKGHIEQSVKSIEEAREIWQV